MKKTFLILLLLPFLSFRCEKDKGIHCYKGKIIRISCASYVIQLLTQDSLGEDQWRDSTSAGLNVYDNVFNVSNKCDIPGNYKAGDIIYFDLENPGTSNCVICMMYDAPPKTQFKIKKISSTPCE
jgi:hypothetical protein